MRTSSKARRSERRTNGSRESGVGHSEAVAFHEFCAKPTSFSSAHNKQDLSRPETSAGELLGSNQHAVLPRAAVPAVPLTPRDSHGVSTTGWAAWAAAKNRGTTYWAQCRATDTSSKSEHMPLGTGGNSIHPVLATVVGAKVNSPAGCRAQGAPGQQGLVVDRESILPARWPCSNNG